MPHANAGTVSHALPVFQTRQDNSADIQRTILSDNVKVMYRID